MHRLSCQESCRHNYRSRQTCHDRAGITRGVPEIAVETIRADGQRRAALPSAARSATGGFIIILGRGDSDACRGDNFQARDLRRCPQDLEDPGRKAGCFLRAGEAVNNNELITGKTGYRTCCPGRGFEPLH